MRTYESIFIVRPDLVGDEYAAVVEKFRNILTDQGANMLKVDEWGAKKMAYPVKKFQRGSYVLMAYEAGPKVIAEFERRLRIDESVIKFQTVHLEKGLPPVAPAKPAPEAAEASDAVDAADEAEENV